MASRAYFPKYTWLIVSIFISIVLFTSISISQGSVKGDQDQLVNFSFTLDTVFNTNHSWVLKLDPNRTRTLVATGDIIPARSVNYQTTTRRDFRWPYLNIVSLLSSSDITLVNLESPLVMGCPITNEGMVFCGDPRNAEGLQFAGVDVANLANNHSNNYGVIGINQTVDILNRINVLPSGLGTPAYKDIRGVKFAFLGYNDLYNDPNLINNIQKDIISVRQSADVIIVSFHWGNEYSRFPTDRQKILAHKAIDSGADLIIGNHPHWIEPLEIYQGKAIMYAHGNTIFDQMWSDETETGVIGKYTFYDNRLIDIEYFPIKIRDYGQPYLLLGKDKSTVLNMLHDASLKLHSP
jgi:gamma-polyglutamate biosynthesis protein CapA